MAMAIEMLEERIRQAVSETWPNLSPEDVASIGLQSARLAELLQRSLGRDGETATSEAQACFANALSAAQSGNAGWVEILDERDKRRIGRGRMTLHDVSPDSPGTDLAGAITMIRLGDGVAPLDAGNYLVRFEENGETRPVQAVCRQDAMLPDTLPVVFLDEGLPISILELSAGE